LNNRAENSHQPTRERERRMRGFKSPGHAQRFLSSFGTIASFFRPGRHLLAAHIYREIMRCCFTQWREFVGLEPAS
jgi:putative transposase